MTNIEQKALELVNEVLAEWGVIKNAVEIPKNSDAFARALLRAIEQHERFRREVSNEILEYSKWCQSVGLQFPLLLERFIISKPDPLVEAMNEWQSDPVRDDDYTRLRAALAKRGGRIVFDD